ncbi:MAG: hypothetical protein EOO14_00040 [Chitinophagaceae bacterium]|nr:MAG: hypothetical protein EOO14_00040 [Chitinophagaceae bacterium]
MNPHKNHSSTLLAGAAKTDITPPLGTFVNGDFVSHYAQWIHDKLYAKALVLQSGDAFVAIVIVDICVLPKEYVDDIKLLIVKQTGIPFQNILIASTHTHAAGSVASVYLCAADLSYSKKLPPLIANAVTKAKQNLRPAKIAFGSVSVPEHVRCRRYFMNEEYQPFNPVSGGGVDKIKTNPFGKERQIVKPQSDTDPEVGFIAIKSLDEQWISLLANYSLHYVGDWDNGTITADYFGFFSEVIQQKLNAGEDFIGMMSNGTSGNINIWDFQQTANYPDCKFEKSKFIGKDIAEKVFQSLQYLQWEEEPAIEVSYTELMIGVRKPDAKELEQAKLVVANSSYENLEINDEGLQSIYAREQILLNELPNELPFPVQAIRIGEGTIGAIAAEVFAETGLWLKELAGKKKYFTIGLANGNCGYLPPAHEFEVGGYETWRSRTSKLEKTAEEKVRNKQLELIKSVQKK